MKFQKIFEQTASSDDMLPQIAVDRLPLSSQGMSEWDESCDLTLFLQDLYGATGYTDIAEPCLGAGIEMFQTYAEMFRQAGEEAAPAPASVSKSITLPDFITSADFGRAAKHKIAWENVISNILSEGGQISLAHLLEMGTDLSCSIHLAGHLYYRQAFQVLRGCIESFVLPLHFSYNLDDFRRWKENSSDLPSLRGKSGLLSKMVNKGILPVQLAESISVIYGNLNDYIHGTEESFNNGGIYSGKWHGFVFQQAKFEQWAAIFSQVIVLSINVLKLSLDQWDKARTTLGKICRTCHSTDLDETSEMVEKTSIIKITCRTCNSTSHVSESGVPIVVTTFESDV